MCLGEFADIYADVERYYTGKVHAHGPTPLGVDWSCVPTQQLRFVQLLKVCDFSRPFSLNDLGCGYGALLAFMARRHKGQQMDYLGVDLSPAMISQATRLWSSRTNTAFSIAHAAHREADFTVASGIFNVKLHHGEASWTEFVQTTLAQIHATSRRGFSINFLAPLKDNAIPELYRPAPETWKAFCEKTLDADVTLLDDYGMREYTLLVRTGA